MYLRYVYIYKDTRGAVSSVSIDTVSKILPNPELTRELIDDVDDADAGERAEELERRDLGGRLKEG